VHLIVLVLLACGERGQRSGFADAAKDRQFLEHDTDLPVILGRKGLDRVNRTLAKAAAVIEELDHRHFGIGWPDEMVAGQAVEFVFFFPDRHLGGVRGLGALLLA